MDAETAEKRRTALEYGIRIVNDGKHAACGTRFYDIATGAQITGVYKATWSHAVGDVPRVVLEAYSTEVQVTAAGEEVERITRCPTCKEKMANHSGLAGSLALVKEYIDGSREATAQDSDTGEHADAG